MKTPRLTNHCFAWNILLGLALAIGAALPLKAQTIVGDTISATLYVTNNIDMNGTTFTQGAVTIGAANDYRLKISNDANVVRFEQRRATAGEWLWEYYNGSTTVTSAKLDATNKWMLYSAGSPTVTLNPVAKSLTLDTAILSAIGANLSASGALTVASGITNTNGTLTGGSTGLALTAGGTNQNITLTPSGSGNFVVTGNSTGKTLATFSTGPLPGDINTYFRVNASRSDSEIQVKSGAGAVIPLSLQPDGGNVGIGTTSPGSRRLNIQSADPTNDVGVEIGLGRTTGANYGLIVSTTGLGASLNQGIFTTARDGSSNYGLRIYNVLASPTNYALYSDSPAQSYFQGNVGIGTTTPGFTLDANGQIHAHYLWAGGGYDGRIYLRNAGNTVVTYLDGATGANSFINNGGNVGINTAIPDKILHVSSDSASIPAVKIGSGTDAQGWYTFLGNDTAGATTSYIGNAYNNDAAAFQIRMKGTTAASARLTVLGNGKVGIGTSAPDALLSLKGENMEISLGRGLAVDPNGYGRIGFNNSYEQYITSNAYWTGSAWNYVNPGGYGGVATRQQSGGGIFQFDTVSGGTNPITWNTRLYIANNGNVGIGTITPSHKLAVKGTIRANEVIVDTGWADYVFDPSYRLAPLSEVESLIKAEKHLPGIPSAAEIAEHGVSMGDMQSKLLSKIEELTLHMIQQEKEIAALRQQVGALQAVSVPKL